MNFYRIKNNTNNPIIIDDIFIKPNHESILSEDSVSSIDIQYFNSNILVNLGPFHHHPNSNYITIDSNKENFYIKPPGGIPKRHLDREVNTILKKIQTLKKENITIDDLDEELKRIILKIIDDNKHENPNRHPGIPHQPPFHPPHNGGHHGHPEKPIPHHPPHHHDSVLIKERQLEQAIIKKLNEGSYSYKKLFKDKIGYDDLTNELKFLIEQKGNSGGIGGNWKDSVYSYELLPLEDNEIGDVRLSLDDFTLWAWDGDTWNPVNIDSEEHEVPIPNLKPRYIIGEFFAEKDQQIFKSNSKFYVGDNSLQVQLNGLLMIKGQDYIEVDNNTISFLYPLEENDYVVMSVLDRDNNSSIVVETVIVKNNGDRRVRFSKSFDDEQENSMQVFLNGISVFKGENEDYTIIDSTTIEFNYDLEEQDKVTLRFSGTTISGNINTRFAQMQKVYQLLAQQVQRLQDVIESQRS
jgi:hypothetical protein